MAVQCPQCRSEILPDAQGGGHGSVSSVLCPTCGSSVVFDTGETVSLGHPARGPRRLGKFEILGELGTGTFGSVYKARDEQLDRVVAIKVPRPGRLDCDESVGRFLREGRSAARLQHPGIVSLYEIGQDGSGCYFLVSEYIDGVTLADRLTAGKLAFQHVAELLVEVSDALAYAHEQGVIHRDIKPSNIMLDLSGRTHILDFGLARRDTEEIVMTFDGQVLGTPAYMSPEQARGESHGVDGRSDVYSLGVVMYQLLTGELPFRGNTRMVLAQVLADEPQPPRRLNDHIPRDLETICLKAMEKDPGRRYESVRELHADLRRYLTGQPILARPSGAASRLWRWCRRNPAAASLLVVVTLSAVVGLWSLSHVSARLQRDTALDGAALQAALLDRVNSFYSNVMVDALSHHPEVPITHRYKEITGGVPIPATFLTDLSDEITASASGLEIRHYSDFPFRFRSGGGPQDDYEREALVYFRATPDATHYARFADYKGAPALRYAVPRTMKESCVGCHNTHPDSTRTDWRAGEVRGVLEIIRPLEADRRRIQAGLTESFTVMAATTVLGLALLLAGIVLQDRRRETVRRGTSPPRGSSLGA